MSEEVVTTPAVQETATQTPPTDEKGGKGKDKKPSKKAQLSNKAKKASLALLSSPVFWKTVVKAAPKVFSLLNDPVWYGGDSNAITGPVGTMIQSHDNIEQWALCLGVLGCEDVSAMISVDKISRNVSSAIAAVDKELGFSSGLTELQFVNVLKASFRLACAFAYVRKQYNCQSVELTADKNHKIQMQDLYQKCRGIVPKFEVGESGKFYFNKRYSRIEIQYDAISKHKWDTDYADAMGDVYTMNQWIQFAEYYFGSFFSNGVDNGTNSIIDIMPFTLEVGLDAHFITEDEDTDTLTISLKKILDYYIKELDDAMSVNKYIVYLLKACSLAKNYNPVSLQRAPLADAYVVRVDGDFITALDNINAYVDEDNDNITLFRYVDDVDFVQQDTTAKLSIGEFGELIKLKLMQADWQMYAGLSTDYTYADIDDVGPSFHTGAICRFGDVGSEPEFIETLDPAEQTQFALAVSKSLQWAVADNHPDYMREIMNYMLFATGYTMGNFTRLVRASGNITISKFLGINDTAQRGYILILNAYKTVGTLTKDSAPAEYMSFQANIEDYHYDDIPTGVDSMLVSDYSTWVAIVQANFTFGQNYKSEFINYIRKITADKLIK